MKSYTDKDNIIKEYEQNFKYDLNENDIDDIHSSGDNLNIIFHYHLVIFHQIL